MHVNMVGFPSVATVVDCLVSLQSGRIQQRINGFANPVFSNQLVFYLDILMACVTFGGTVDSQVTQKAVQICHFVLNSG